MTPSSLDPAVGNPYDGVAARSVYNLIFDKLVTLDDRGFLQPALATSWQAEPGGQRWRFQIRQGVTCHDGTPLTSDVVAASLRAANSNWKVVPTEEAVVIETDSPAANLPIQMTLARYSIAKRSGTKLIGTGPYSISQWDPGKKLSLAARDDYWNGRPFVDAIEIEFGKNVRDQMISLDVGRADVIEVAPDQARHAASENRRIEIASPAELMALVFARDPQSPDEARLRQALSLSVDRTSLSKVLFQGGADPTGALLPDWMTGYSFLFPSTNDALSARQARGDAKQTMPWNLNYDATDPMARFIAERIALNARDVGISVQTGAVGTSDIRIVRAPLISLDSRSALTGLATMLGVPAPKFGGDSMEDLYGAESSMLNARRVLPLLHVRAAYANSRAVRNWSADREGVWRLDDVWLSADKP